MAKTILIKRGLEANRTGITPATGELIWTTDNHDLWMGDGSTAGGIKVTGNIESNYIPTSEKGANNGVATLGATGLIPNGQLPPLAITSTYTAASQAAQLALTAQEGDVCVRTDENKSYIHNGGSAGDMTDWQELLTPTDSVTSVNGQTGVVSLDTDDITEGSTNVYYTDTRVSNYLTSTATLSQLSDVNISSISDGEVITWVAANSRWENTAIPSGVTNFVGLSDTPSNYTGAGGQFLKVNAGATAVEFGTTGIDELSDVDTTTSAPSNGEVLAWDGTNWVPTADSDTTYSAGTGLSLTGTTFALNASIDDLTDVDTTTSAPNVDEILGWDGSNWVPGANIDGGTF